MYLKLRFGCFLGFWAMGLDILGFVSGIEGLATSFSAC